MMIRRWVIFTNNNKKIEIIGYTDKSAVFQIRISD